MLGTTYTNDVKAVGYFTENNLTNTGQHEWTDSLGMPCIWILDMFPPSAATTVIIPYKKNSAENPVNTSYFGEIPPDRVKYPDSTLFFKADGRMRSKVGILPGAAKNRAGSYDADKKILTITII